MTRGGLNILGSFLASLLLANNVHEVQCGISISAAAASGANYALGGGGGQPQFRDEESEALILLLVASAVGGIIVVMVLYVLWRLFRRYVLKIREPPGNNFQVDKKVKCRAGKYQLDEEAQYEDDSMGTETPPPKYENVSTI